MKTINMDDATFNFLKKLLELDEVQKEGRIVDEEQLVIAYETFHKRRKQKGVGGWE